MEILEAIGHAGVRSGAAGITGSTVKVHEVVTDGVALCIAGPETAGIGIMKEIGKYIGRVGRETEKESATAREKEAGTGHAASVLVLGKIIGGIPALVGRAAITDSRNFTAFYYRIDFFALYVRRCCMAAGTKRYIRHTLFVLPWTTWDVELWQMGSCPVRSV